MRSAQRPWSAHLQSRRYRRNWTLQPEPNRLPVAVDAAEQGVTPTTVRTGGPLLATHLGAGRGIAEPQMSQPDGLLSSPGSCAVVSL